MAQGWGQTPPQEAKNDNPGWGEYPAIPAVVAADPSLPPAKKAKVGEGKRFKLDSARTIRLEMARTYKAMKSGELDPTRATKMIYVLTELSRAMERENVEKLSERLDDLEGK